MKSCYTILFLLCLQQTLWAQDSTIRVVSHSPKKATNRSAILPGLGQAYNQQYWKIPLVYGVLAVPVVTYVYNNDLYAKTKFAYEARIQEANGNNDNVSKIDPTLKNLSAGSLQSYRNIFRKNRDVSIMWFIIAWGINVVDASVSGHLKEFDVSHNLSMKMAPMRSDALQQAGLSLQLNWKYTK